MNPPALPPPARSRPIRREVKTLVAGISVILIGHLAIPKLINADYAQPVEAEIVPEDPAPVPPAPSPAPGPRTPVATRPVEPPRVATAPVSGPVAADGALVVEVKVRWARASAGTTLPATVHFRNTGGAPFQLPAPGEPHPTLALVILDGEGHVVRRVVETGPDAYPRRTSTIGPGESIELQVVLVAGEDRPLEAGEYTVYAEMKHDPVWDRLALPMWNDPKGSVRSLQEPFTITAKTP